MISAEGLLLARSHRQHQVVSRSQLEADGLTDSDIRRLRRRGLLRSTPAPGVYGVGQPPSGPASELVAATLGIAGAAAYRRTAARVLELPGTARLAVEPLEVVAPYGAASESPWAEVHRSRHLPPVDLADHGPYRVTSVARTFCDLSTLFGNDRLRHLGERLLVDELVALDDLAGCAAGFVRRGRPGSGRVREVMSRLDVGRPLPASVLESLFIDRVVVPFSLPLVGQFRPPWYTGLDGVTDFGHASAQLIVEVDGRRWHQLRQDFDEDRRRDRRAARHGYATLRYTAPEIRRDPAAIAAEIALLIERRAA